MMADMGTLPKKIQQLAGDYKVHLIQMRFIPDEDLAKMGRMRDYKPTDQCLWIEYPAY